MSMSRKEKRAELQTARALQILRGTTATPEDLATAARLSQAFADRNAMEMARKLHDWLQIARRLPADRIAPEKNAWDRQTSTKRPAKNAGLGRYVRNVENKFTTRGSFRDPKHNPPKAA